MKGLNMYGKEGDWTYEALDVYKLCLEYSTVYRQWFKRLETGTVLLHVAKSFFVFLLPTYLNTSFPMCNVHRCKG